jgi:hypothetical protein
VRDQQLTDLDGEVSTTQALFADIAANEDPAVQLAKRPRDAEGNCQPRFFFPFQRLVKWTAREDWPTDEERNEIACGPCTIEGANPWEDLNDRFGTFYTDCKLGGWVPWVRGTLLPQWN